MICSKCGALNSEGLLACPTCVSRAFDKAFEARQRNYLQRVADGTASLFGTSKRGVQHVIHAKASGAAVTYCGLPTTPRLWESGKLLWDKLDAPIVCAACRININRILARPAEVA